MGDPGDDLTRRDELPATDERARLERRSREDQDDLGERKALGPEVGPAIVRGIRPGFAIAAALVVIFALGGAALYVWRIGAPSSIVVIEQATASEPRSGLPAGCTALEVEQTIRSTAMSDTERVTCLAVAGKIDRARFMLRDMPLEMQSRVIAHVFAVAHPIADRGDDASAGPIMWLVVEFWPQNYMAVFHAGMADFALGRDDAARTQLENFLQMYPPQDVWRARAERALAAIGARVPLAQREAHFPE